MMKKSRASRRRNSARNMVLNLLKVMGYNQPSTTFTGSILWATPVLSGTFDGMKTLCIRIQALKLRKGFMFVK